MESLIPGRLFTMYSWKYRRTWRRLKQIKHVFSSPKLRVVTTEQKNRPGCYKIMSSNHNQKHSNLKKRLKTFHFWHNCIELPIVSNSPQSTNIFRLNYQFTHFQSAVRQYYCLRFQRKVESFVDFGPDADVLTTKDVFQEMMISFHEN